MKPKIVIYTNIVISALLSKRGAANKLLSIIGDEKYHSYLSVPLVFEYEEVIRRCFPQMPNEDIDVLIGFICKQSFESQIYYLWRPFLKDPKDDMVLEVAVASSVDFIVTYNVKDFVGVEEFGLAVASPKEILHKIGALK